MMKHDDQVEKPLKEFGGAALNCTGSEAEATRCKGLAAPSDAERSRVLLCPQVNLCYTWEVYIE